MIGSRLGRRAGSRDRSRREFRFQVAIDRNNIKNRLKERFNADPEVWRELIEVCANNQPGIVIDPLNPLLGSCRESQKMDDEDYGPL
jgi:hypothetical protein